MPLLSQFLRKKKKKQLAQTVAKTVLYISSDTALAKDTVTIGLIEAAGFTVTEVSHLTVTEADGQGKNIIIFSDSATDLNIAGLFANSSKTLMFFGPTALGGHNLASTVSAGPSQSIVVTDNSHPITNGIALGSNTVLSSGTGITTYTYTLSEPTVLATYNDVPCLLVWNKDDVIDNGGLASGKRIATWLSGQAGQRWNATSTAMLTNMLNWAVNTTVGQPGNPDPGDPPIQSPSDEYTELINTFGEAQATIYMQRRYGNDTLTRTDASVWNGLLGTPIGQTFRDPVFGYKCKVISNQVKNINAERNHWNHDESLAFWRLGTSLWGLFNGTTLELLDTFNLTYNGVNPTDGVRWHPKQNYLFYPIGNQLIKYDVDTQTTSVLYTSPHGILGTSNRRLAGGDGNGPVYSPSADASYMLISHDGSGTEYQVLNLDNGNIVTDVYDSGWSRVEVPWDASSPKWDVPAGTIDYATLSEEVNGKMYVIVAADGAGTRVYDFSGRYIGEIYSNANHMNQVICKVAGVDKHGLIMKVTGGLVGSTSGDSPGDMVCVHYTVDDSTITKTVTSDDFRILDWIGAGEAGGGQHSYYARDKYTMMMAMNSAEANGITGWNFGYDEVIEVKFDDSDVSFRRIIQHMVNVKSPVDKQPEAWIKPDGTIMVYKTDNLGNTGGNGYLVAVEIPERTPINDRP